ncbi:GNAT family N-acetyltransferase [Anaerotignum faecicola]|nr:GNAT family N-acetyltransferase [Anaerotignum faecicola]
MKILYTDRLILRPVSENDAEDIFEYSSFPQVGIDAGWKPHENIGETKEVMKEVFLDKENVWGIVIKECGKLIGTIGFIDDVMRENPNVKALGYAIGKDYWGKGYATECAGCVVEYGIKNLGLDGISVTCYDYNKASEKVIKKCGFRFEGLLHKAEVRFDGAVLNKKVFFLDKEDL